MARPGKALKRSAKAIERLSKKTSARVENAQNQLDAGTYTADQFSRDVAGQALDAWGSFFDMLRAGRDTPPDVFIDIQVTGGGGNVTRGATANLDDTVANIGLFQKTALVTPGTSIPVASIALSNPGAGPDVDDLRIDVTVPNTQQVGLYQGFISVGSTVQVSVNVSVHT
jgi:hypothetical protein